MKLPTIWRVEKQSLAGIELAVEQVTAIAEQMAEIIRALRGAKSYACSAQDTPTSVSIIGD